MPIKLLISYICSKYNKERQRETYEMDMLWAAGSGRAFEKYPRWHELNAKIPEKSKKDTGKEILDELLTAW